ncbi:MAG: glycosyltransferase [Verrucomicrobiota bacterium]
MKISKKKIYDIPVLGYLLHLIEAFFRLPKNDSRIKKLLQDVKSTNSSFIDISTSFIDISNKRMMSLAQMDSFSRLQAGQERTPQLAFVSCLPPEETGIATCSLYSWLDSEVDVDIFCPVVNEDFYFYNKSELSSKRVQLYDVDTLMSAVVSKQYKNIVLTIGNSDHHAYLFQALKKLRAAGMMGRVALYVHDPVMLNITKWRFNGLVADLSANIIEIYDDVLGHDSRTDHTKFNGCWYGEYGIAGVRIFLKLGITKFLVNSEAAKSILEGDLPKNVAKVSKIFHPVFLPKGMNGGDLIMRNDREEIIVGTFGMPRKSKQTELIVAACKHLASTGHNIKLVIAGFGAEKYVRTIKKTNLNIVGYSDLTDGQLSEVMASVDVAVQLRLSNMGESSGVVPQLLALCKNVIVSDVGAFAEFGSATKKVPTDIRFDNLAATILEVLADDSYRDAMRAYAALHSPKAFRATLLSSLADLSSDTSAIADSHLMIQQGMVSVTKSLEQ